MSVCGIRFFYLYFFIYSVPSLFSLTKKKLQEKTKNQKSKREVETIFCVTIAMINHKK